MKVEGRCTYYACHRGVTENSTAANGTYHGGCHIPFILLMNGREYYYYAPAEVQASPFYLHGCFFVSLGLHGQQSEKAYSAADTEGGCVSKRTIIVLLFKKEKKRN